MSAEDKENRYREQLKMSGFARENQDRLEAGHVLICGGGTVAQMVALCLINSGIGAIKIVGPDQKALNRLGKILGPLGGLAGCDLSCEYVGCNPLGDGGTGEELLLNCHAVVDSLSSWQEKLELSDSCMQFRKPLVHAGGGGLRYQIYTMVPGRSACLRCLLAKTDMEDIARIRMEEGSLYAMENLVASFLALEVIKIVGRVGASQANELLKIDGLSGELEIMRGMDRNLDCPDCGELRAGQ